MECFVGLKPVRLNFTRLPDTHILTFDLIVFERDNGEDTSVSGPYFRCAMVTRERTYLETRNRGTQQKNPFSGDLVIKVFRITRKVFLLKGCCRSEIDSQSLGLKSFNSLTFTLHHIRLTHTEVKFIN